MMRILILSRALPFHHLGGMEAVAWDLARALSVLGHEVAVVTTSADSLSSDQIIEGVRIVSTNSSSGKYSAQWNRDSVDMYESLFRGRTDALISISAAGFAVAKHIVRSEKVDDRPKRIMQAHGTSWGEFVSKLKTRSVVNALKSLRNVWGFVQDYHYKYFDAVVAVGPKVTEDLDRFPTKHILGTTRHVAIKNGIDEVKFRFDLQSRLDFRRSLGYSDADKVVVSASRLHQQKGVAESIEGFALASGTDPDLKFLVVGSGPDEARIKAIVSERALADKVKVYGAVPREQLPKVISAADAFLFTSLRVEGLPLNVLEALASGLVPITSFHLSGQGFDTISVDPRDPHSISDGIKLALDSQDGRSSKLAEEYTLAGAAKRYVDVLQRP